MSKTKNKKRKKKNEHISTNDKKTIDELNKDLNRNNTFTEGFKYKRKFSELKDENDNKKLF